MRKTHLTAKLVVEAVGYSGCIWIVWDDSRLHVEPVSFDEQIINLLVYQDSPMPWLLSAIYASPNPLYRQDLWEYLFCLGRVVNVPWLLLGDFNQILISSENKGGASPLIARMDALWTVLRSCNLMDMGFFAAAVYLDEHAQRTCSDSRAFGSGIV